MFPMFLSEPLVVYMRTFGSLSVWLILTVPDLAGGNAASMPNTAQSTWHLKGTTSGAQTGPSTIAGGVENERISRQRSS